jgi:hypothetical protein
MRYVPTMPSFGRRIIRKSTKRPCTRYCVYARYTAPPSFVPAGRADEGAVRVVQEADEVAVRAAHHGREASLGPRRSGTSCFL